MNISTLTLTMTAAAALTANRFITGSPAAAAVPAAGVYCLGVTRSDAASGDLVPIDCAGTAMVEASAAIAAGAAVETTNNGRAVTKSTGIAVGRALTAAAQAGDLIEVHLIPN